VSGRVGLNDHHPHGVAHDVVKLASDPEPLQRHRVVDPRISRPRDLFDASPVVHLNRVEHQG
jgi:hypothetical protein